jgi:hypothetical protein
VIGCGVAALPLWWLVSRLRSGYFAIATCAGRDRHAHHREVLLDRRGTGMALPGFAGMDPALLTAYTHWAGLAVTVVALATIYPPLRGRLACAHRHPRRRGGRAQLRGGSGWPGCWCCGGVYCGAAGAVLAISQLQVQPSAVFSAVDRGDGVRDHHRRAGDDRGLIMAPRCSLRSSRRCLYNAWYLIILGLVAIFVALSSGAGLWGLRTSASTCGCSRLGIGSGWTRHARAGSRGAARWRPRPCRLSLGSQKRPALWN